MYGGLDQLPGYTDPDFQYEALTPPAHLNSEQKKAWLAEQGLNQERRRVDLANRRSRDAALRGYDQSIANNRRFADTFDQMYQGYGDSQRQELDRARLQQLAQARGNLGRRGLGNTTIADSLNRGVEFDAQRSRSALEDQLTQNRINLNAQSLGRENQLTGQRLNFLTGINEQGPTLDQVIGYGMMPAQIEAAQNAANAQAAQTRSGNLKKGAGAVVGGLVGLAASGGNPMGAMAGAQIGGSLAGGGGDTTGAFNAMSQYGGRQPGAAGTATYSYGGQFDPTGSGLSTGLPYLPQRPNSLYMGEPTYYGRTA
jgi:hypothetical protein